MAQYLPHPTTGEPTYFTRDEWYSQGRLFASSALPRQLPLYKEGPEDEIFARLANQATHPMH